jgi:hypothetical protein
LQTENEHANIAYMQRVEKLADLTGYTPPPGAAVPVWTGAADRA